MLLINEYWANISKMKTLENIGFRYFFDDSPVFLLYFYSWHLMNGNDKAY